MFTYPRNKVSTRGFSLLEILIAIVIIAILAAFMGIQVRNLTQRARVAAAKTTISGFGLALSSIKTHTGFYPQFLADTTKTYPPAGFTKAGIDGWWGPYSEGLPLIDPWGNPYLYFLDEGNIFSPKPIQRFYNIEDKIQIFNFTAWGGRGTIIVENHGVDDPVEEEWIKLNGKIIIDDEKFEKFEEGVIIGLPITLLYGKNTLKLYLSDDDPAYIDVRIASWVSVDTTFTLLSYGADGKPGGTGFNADIIYREF